MHRRDMIKALGLGALAASTAQWPFTLYASTNPKKVQRKNWAWVLPETGKPLSYWKTLFANAKTYGIDGIIFEAYDSRNAYYDASHLPVAEDILSKLIPICQSLELELHAWMHTMPCNVKKIVEEHPDWYAVNGKGESAVDKPAYVDYYKFLDPCNPEAQAFINSNVESLAKIAEVDAVHLDYVRLPDVIIAEALQPKYNVVQDREYPEFDYSYSKACRTQFKAQTGIDPLLDLKDPSANKEWRQFRYDSVTNLVNGKLVPTARKHKKQVSAAVFPNWRAVRQEWRVWDLDCFMPMLYHNFYNADLNWIGNHIKRQLVELKSPKPIYSGLFVPKLNPAELSQAYKISMDAGASGISLFHLGEMKAAHWKALKKALSV